MSRTAWTAGLVLVALAACQRKPTPAPAAQSAAPPPLSAERRALGDKAVAQNCQMCHSLDLVDSQRLARASWQKEVKKMIGWGAPVPAEDEPLIVDALSARAGVDLLPAAPREVAAADVDAEVAPDAHPPAGDAHKGAALYRVACAICHGPTGAGGSGGPALIDRPVVYRARDFDAVVRAGRERMPAFPLDTAAIQDVLAFLRTHEG